MVARVVAGRRMRKIEGRPVLRRMTLVALLSRLEMFLRHAVRGRAVVT